MRRVSDAYKATMEKLIRPMTQFKGELELTDVALRNEAEIELSEQADFATGDILADIHEYDYITLEPNYFKLDSKQIIVPDDSSYKNNGYVSDVQSLEDSTFETTPTIKLSFTKRELLGLSYQFIGYFPTEIDVVTYLNGNVVQEYISTPDALSYTDNTKLEICDSIFLTFKSMSGAYNRLRVGRIIFGLVKMFDNSDLLSLEHTSFVDPVSSSLSYKKLKMQLINLEKKFNPDNPSGIWQYFENNQPINIYYGIPINEDESEIEWLQGDRLYLSNAPTTDSNSVTFEANDLITTLTTIYYKGMYAPNGKTLYELAEIILAEAGIKEYSLDDTLKTFTTKAPIPNLSYREIFQLIANAGHCVFYCDSTGKVTIESQLESNVIVSDNDHMWYSKSQDAYDGVQDYEYVTLEPDKFKLNSRFVIIPSDDANYSDYKKVGYISNEMSNYLGTFENNPKLTIQYSLPITAYAFSIEFNKNDNVCPLDFTITFYNDTEIIYKEEIENNKLSEYSIDSTIDKFDKVVIEISKMSAPNRRAEIRSINKGRSNDFYLDFSMAYDKPTVKLIDQVSDVNVIAYDYTVGDMDEIATSEVDCNGTEQTLSITYGAATNISVSVENGTLISSTLYAEIGYVTVTGSGTVNISIKGNTLVTKEKIATTKVFDNGEPVKIDNPLISEITNAQSIANWIANYMKFRNSYETEIRQDYRLEANDPIYMKSDFESMIPSRISKVQLKLPGQEGSVTVRRLAQ